MIRFGISRRRLWRVLALLLMRPGRVLAQSVDQGIGGTGVVGDPKDESDQTIGGTGVVGTIRRFGSIYVNDLRIAYPADLPIATDLPRTPPALKIGHVVRAAVTGPQAAPVARFIAVVHEVVGPVDAVDAGGLTVLGQRVSLPDAIAPSKLRRGQTVAISGLRRLDGTIVASLVEAVGPGPLQVAGPLVRASDGSLTIGRLRVTGLDPALVGERVTVSGQRHGDALEVAHVATERALLARLGTARWSIEGYVSADAGHLRFGSGLAVAAAGLATTSLDVSVVDVVLDARQRLTAEAVTVETPTRSTDSHVPGAKATGDRGGSKHNGGSGSGGRSGSGGHR